MEKVKNSFADSLKDYLEKNLGAESKPHITHNNGFVFAARGGINFDEVADLIAKYCGNNGFCTSTRGTKHPTGPDHFTGIYASKGDESNLINIIGEEGAVAVLVY